MAQARPERENQRRALEAALTASGLASAWDEGRAMTVEDAVRLALNAS